LKIDRPCKLSDHQGLTQAAGARRGIYKLQSGLLHF